MSRVSSDFEPLSNVGPFEPSDGSLLRRFRRGEEDAATQLFVRYSNRLLKLTRANTAQDLRVRFDPEDVVQSVFRSFFRRAAGGCYDVPAGGELWRLLLVLALNKIRGLGIHHRAKKRNVRQTVSTDEIDFALNRAVAEDPEPYTILELVIKELLRRMPSTQQRIVELRIEGQTVSGIAAATHRSRRTVERVLQSFRAELSERIQEDRPSLP